MGLLIVGLGFKVAAVPFHFWTPDVYQGSPTPFTGYMAAVAKAAGFAGLLRVLNRCAPHPAGQLAADHLGHRRADPAGRVGPGPRPEGPEADARLLVDQPGRLCAGRRPGCVESREPQAPCSTFSPTRSSSSAASRWCELIQGPGEARNDLGAIRGSGPPPAAPGAGDAGVPAGPGGRAVYQRASSPSST